MLRGRGVLLDNLKYYGFDWDDNLLFMPTKIHLLKKGKQISISTKEFATLRCLIGNGEYQLLPNGESFRDFGTDGDEQFEIDSFLASFGPSWVEFTKCVNNARIFAIITARGHSEEALHNTVKKIIKKSHGGINLDQVLENKLKFLKLAIENGKNIKILDDEEWLLDEYMKILHFYSVSNQKIMKRLGNNSGATSPEKAKERALNLFVEDIRKKVLDISSESNRPKVSLGFSDDDPENIKHMKLHIEKGGIGDDIIPYLFNTFGGGVEVISF